MRWAKILVVVASSVWFVPVSCTAGLLAGTNLASLLDARDVSKGDTVHSRFSIVSESSGSETPFVVVKLSDLRNYEKLLPPDARTTDSYLMSKPSGHMSDDFADYSYRVLEETESGQIIEVIEAYHDGDNTIWSRYETTGSTITPQSSRMFYFGYTFAAFPYALGFSFLVYGVGRYFERRMRSSGYGEQGA